MAWFEWPLILSSVLAGVAIGAFLINGAVILSGKLCFGQSDRLHRTMPVLWLMIFLSMFFRETTLILAAAETAYQPSLAAILVFTFFALALIYWFAEKALWGSDGLRRSLLVLVMLVGAGIFLLAFQGHGFVMQNDSRLAVGYFLAVVLCGGTLLAHTMLIRAEHKVEPLNRILPYVGLAIAVVGLLAALPQLTILAEELELMGEVMPFVTQLLSVGLLLGALGVWFMPALTRSKPVAGVMIFALGLNTVAAYLVGTGI